MGRIWSSTVFWSRWSRWFAPLAFPALPRRFKVCSAKSQLHYRVTPLVLRTRCLSSLAGASYLRTTSEACLASALRCYCHIPSAIKCIAQVQPITPDRLCCSHSASDRCNHWDWTRKVHRADATNGVYRILGMTLLKCIGQMQLPAVRGCVLRHGNKFVMHQADANENVTEI